MTDIHHILILTAAIVMTAAVTAILTTRKTRRKVSYMLDALEDKELNFRFDENRLFGRKRPDILCSAISALVISTINSLEELAGDILLSYM